MPLSDKLQAHIEWCTRNIHPILPTDYEAKTDLTCPIGLGIPKIPITLNGHIYGLENIYDFQRQKLKISQDPLIRDPIQESDIKIPDNITKNAIIEEITRINAVYHPQVEHIQAGPSCEKRKAEEALHSPPHKHSTFWNIPLMRDTLKDKSQFPYFQQMNRISAVELLLKQPDGTYLFRPSSENGKHVLSIKIGNQRPNGFIIHILFDLASDKSITTGILDYDENGKKIEKNGEHYQSLEQFLSEKYKWVQKHYQIELKPVFVAEVSPPPVLTPSLKNG
ncbi:MAG: SH2 domain-containing protein [Gammaproteobacteria bacterium]